MDPISNQGPGPGGSAAGGRGSPLGPPSLRPPSLRPPAVAPPSFGERGAGPANSDPLRGLQPGDRIVPLGGEDGALGATGESGGAASFAAQLGEAIDRVDSLQRDSSEQAAALARGEPVDLHEVLVSMERSDVAFRLMLEVRNRLLDAWQTLTRTPI